MVFGKSTPTPFSVSSNTTFIAEDCQINGKITIKGNARIDGHVEGNIIVNGDLSIGSNANLNANIEAKTVSIAGQVRGDVKTSEHLELCSSARLFGDIFTKQLKIEQGATFVGTSHQLDPATESKLNPSEQIKKANETSGMEEESQNFRKDKKR